MCAAIPVFVERAVSAPRSQRVWTTSRAPFGPLMKTPSACQTLFNQKCPGATLPATNRNDSSARDQSTSVSVAFSF